MNALPHHAAPLAVEPLITKETVGERLATHPDTIAKWFCAGRIPGYRIGRRLRFKWSEIERHLAQTNRVAPRPVNGGPRP